MAVTSPAPRGKVSDSDATSEDEALRPVRMPRIHKLRISESEHLVKFPMDLGIPPLRIRNPTESEP